jgi:hypothetical protein
MEDRLSRLSKLAALAVGSLALLTAGSAAAAESPFKNWAAMFVAADYQSSTGADTDVFDNGRQDLAKAFIAAGFSPENILHVSTRAYRYTDPKPIGTEPPIAFANTWKALAEKAPAGCLVFVTSHGSPEGVVFGFQTRSPANLARLIDDACGARPTVAIISACYSGVFVPALSGPNRMVMTAARPDRSSFGCGSTDVYTFFDACLIQSMPKAKDFGDLPAAVRTCVDAKEAELGVIPEAEAEAAIRAQRHVLLPSGPQTSIGETFQASIARYAFGAPAAAQRTYTVRPGDTLARIAQLTLGDARRADEILKVNQPALKNANSVRIGQQLRIPPQ